ncbi:hypothetical protein B0T10DRAFT_318970 [Thelonectria olida]|uniref:NCT transcriptional regulatory complex subunit A n=1 Tax=Thelonectria olida TaxID=1576542 RepID=A0A9P8W6C2_9HYPO|nr:hypothetical protein B0T10DRAFT_318970 [Thelonectria olida]
MSADNTYYAPKSPNLSLLDSVCPTTDPAPQQPLHRPQAAGSHQGLEYKENPFAYTHRPTSFSSDLPPFEYHHHDNHQQSQYQTHAYPPLQPPQASTTASHQTYFPTAQQKYLPPSPERSIPPPTYRSYPVQYAHVQQYPEPVYGLANATQNSHTGVAQLHTDNWEPSADAPRLHTPRSSSDAPAPSQKVIKARRRSEMPPRRAPPPPAPEIEPSPVKTKFPTARIKRIMQADEEVGKVAQQTPIAVGKALELFMIQMVSKSADIAKDKGSKRVTASMLKQVVEEDDQWDFLRDIVSRVENEKEGKAKAKAESSSDEEMVEPKKRTRGGRKKKV